MSYILDALKRADAERERGAVPGLHARQIVPPLQAAYSVQQRVWVTVAAILALVGMAAAGLWIWPSPDDSVRLAVVEPAAVKPPAPMPSTQPAPAASAPPSAPQPALGASRAALAPPLPAGAPAAVKPAPPARAMAVQPKPRPQPEPVAKATASQAPVAVRLLSELPENLRRQIPPLAISGSVYSRNPDKRLLLVNNQVLTQGSPAAPEVTLVEIQAKSSVFSFRGTRFRLVH